MSAPYPEGSDAGQCHDALMDFHTGNATLCGTIYSAKALLPAIRDFFQI